MSVIFRGVTIADPQSPFHGQQADVLVRDGKIAEIGPAGSLKGSAPVADLPSGSFISPGWVDMLVNLSDPGFEWKETLAQLAQAAQFGGFTQIVCMPNTQPVIDNSQILRSIIQRIHGLPVEFWLTGALTSGTKGEDLAEMYDMAVAGAVAFGDGSHAVQKPGVVLRALQYLRAFDGVMVSPADEKSVSGSGQMNEGDASTRLGMKGIPEISETLAVARDLEIWSYTGGRIHFQPLSTSAALLKVREANGKGTLSTGTAIAYLTLDEDMLETYDPVYKIFPPLRNRTQQASLLKALEDGLIDTLGSGHHPQGLEEKEVEFETAEPGMLGLQTFFPLACERLIHQGVIDLARFVELVCVNPRRILGKEKVSVEKGNVADLTVFNPEIKWEFSSAHISARSKNSPFIGKTMTGRVLGTCLKGQWQPSML
ncbi:MAG: dihydroorotase [Bacteroidia bacterium]